MQLFEFVLLFSNKKVIHNDVILLKCTQKRQIIKIFWSVKGLQSKLDFHKNSGTFLDKQSRLFYVQMSVMILKQPFSSKNCLPTDVKR